MNRRALLAVLAFGVLVVTSGCLGLMTGPVDEEQLDQPPAEPYEWDADVDVHITITTDVTFRAVYQVEGEREELHVFRRDGLGGQNPIPVRSVRYQYPNGTVIDGSELRERGGDVVETNDEVVLRFPDDRPLEEPGKVAFTSDSTPKRFSLPVFIEGSYEVVLPERRYVDFFLFGNVNPPEDEREIIDERTHLRWEEVTSRSIVIHFYMDRDLPIFGGLVGILSVVAVVGVLRYRRKIRELREQREEMGLDVEDDDDDFDDRGPPPGMR